MAQFHAKKTADPAACSGRQCEGDHASPGLAQGLTRRQFLGGALAGTLGAGLLATGALSGGCAGGGIQFPGRARRRPNLLFIFDDQHSWDMLGCYGNDQAVTPNLDRFAAQGVRFNYCVSSAPLCTPYRGMLMSGQHPLYSGAYTNDVRMLPNNGKNFAEVLRDAGYRTGYVGKWHLYGGNRDRPIPPGPERYGFDELFLSNNCHVDFRAGYCYYWNDKGEKVFFQEWEVYGQTRQALEFLDRQNGDAPFALFVSWHPPHDHGKRGEYYLYDTLPELRAHYDPAKIRLRPSVPDTPERRDQYCDYLAQCTGVDTAFGWLIDKLREKGFADNTVVVFTSDHGDTLGSHGRTLPKVTPDDESVRVPLMIRAPGLTARASDLLVGTLDLMPTILSLMDLPIPPTCQGQDLAGAIRQGRDDAVESVPLFQPMFNWRGIFTRRYTYATSLGDDRENKLLFDRQADPYGMRNLYDDPAHKDLQERLHRLTLAWMERFGDRFVDWRILHRTCCVDAPGLPNKDRSGLLRGRPIDLLKNAKGAV